MDIPDFFLDAHAKLNHSATVFWLHIFRFGKHQVDDSGYPVRKLQLSSRQLIPGLARRIRPRAVRELYYWKLIEIWPVPSHIDASFYVVPELAPGCFKRRGGAQIARGGAQIAPPPDSFQGGRGIVVIDNSNQDQDKEAMSLLQLPVPGMGGGDCKEGAGKASLNPERSQVEESIPCDILDQLNAWDCALQPDFFQVYPLEQIKDCIEYVKRVSRPRDQRSNKKVYSQGGLLMYLLRNNISVISEV